MATTTYTPPANGWRTFVIVWLSQSLSLFGSAITAFALSIWLTTVAFPGQDQKSELAQALALLGLAGGIPIIFGAPIAGAFADRHDRRRIMIAGDVLNGALSLLLMGLIYGGTLEMGSLLALTALMAVVAAFHGAAFDTSYAMLVQDRQLARANGMMQTMWSLSALLSPGLAAAIISLPALLRQNGVDAPVLTSAGNGTWLAVLIDALTFFFAAVVLIFLRIPSPKRTDLVDDAGRTTRSLWADMREGALYIWDRRPMLWLLGTFAFANFAGGITQTLAPLVVKFDLAASFESLNLSYEAALAIVFTLGSIGGIVGGVFISAWGGLRRRRVRGVVLPMLIEGLTMIVFALAGMFPVAVFAVLVQTAMTPILNAHSQSVWQSQTPREMQGRVFSVRRLIAQFTAPISIFLAGVLGARFEAASVIAVMGAVFTLFCALQFFNPYLMRVEDKAWLDELAARKAAARAGRA